MSGDRVSRNVFWSSLVVRNGAFARMPTLRVSCRETRSVCISGKRWRSSKFQLVSLLAVKRKDTNFF